MDSGIEVPVQHTLRINLHGSKDNVSYTGTLLIRNLSSIIPDDIGDAASNGVDEGMAARINDPSGASYYVVAVVMVYGFSIVMLIASHIKRKHQKLVEDRQINKYLQEFMVVQEKSSRDNYRHLKRTIIQKLNRDKSQTSRHLSKAIFPMMAIALPNPNTDESLHHLEHRRSLAARRASMYQSLEEDGPSQDSGSSTPQPDRSLEPFEGADPALLDSSFNEGSDQEVDVQVDQDTGEDDTFNETSSTAASSAIYLPAITLPLSEMHSKSEGGNKDARSPTPKSPSKPEEGSSRVSWSDLPSDLPQVAKPGTSRRTRGVTHSGSLDDCQYIHRPPSPILVKKNKKRRVNSDFEKWAKKCDKQRRSIDPQFDLAAALLRKSLAYNKQMAEKQRNVRQLPSAPAKEEFHSSESNPADISDQTGQQQGQQRTSAENRRSLSRLDTSQHRSAGDYQRDSNPRGNSSVWMMDEIRRHNGLMREEDPELYSLRHGHGMGSASPLLKEASPVTPPSPHFGARLTPQPLLTPPPAKSKRNPFFHALHSTAQRSSSSPDYSPSSSRRSTSPADFQEGRLIPRPSSMAGRTSPSSPTQHQESSETNEDDEDLLHITCV